MGSPRGARARTGTSIMGCAQGKASETKLVVDEARHNDRRMEFNEEAGRPPERRQRMRRSSFMGEQLMQTIEAQSKKPTGRTVALGEFERVRLFARGMYGRLTLVRHHGETYALKVMNKGQLLHRNQLEHVMSERAILKDYCNHPFLQRFLGAYQDTHEVYLLLDLLLGGDLWSVIHQPGKRGLPVEQAKFYGASVCAAFEFLHSNGVIYRDLKPENVLLDLHGYIRVCDMGFAKVIGQCVPGGSNCRGRGRPFSLPCMHLSAEEEAAPSLCLACTFLQPLDSSAHIPVRPVMGARTHIVALRRSLHPTFSMSPLTGSIALDMALRPTGGHSACSYSR